MKNKYPTPNQILEKHSSWENFVRAAPYDYAIGFFKYCEHKQLGRALVIVYGESIDREKRKQIRTIKSIIDSFEDTMPFGKRLDQSRVDPFFIEDGNHFFDRIEVAQ